MTNTIQTNQRDILYKYSFRLTGSEDFSSRIADACSDMEPNAAYHKATQMAAEMLGRKANDPVADQERLLAWINSPQKLRELLSFLDDLPPERRTAFVMRHQAEMSMSAIAEFLSSDHCAVVYHVMEAEKDLLAKMGLPARTPLPNLDGKPFFKAILEMS